jgi:hypothetical protein
MLRLLLSGFAAMVALGILATSALGANLPSGEVVNGQATLEPAYNDANGSLIYLLTPNKAQVNPPANGKNLAPLYVVMYPTSAAGAVGTMNCQHQPQDNCPDHGPLTAAIAKGLVPSISPGEPGVYGAGVWGHDHLLAAPGSGGDFNQLWLPIEVLFTTTAAANTHVLTLTQLQADFAAGRAIQIPLPPAIFHCSVVSASVYNNGTPVAPVPGLP